MSDRSDSVEHVRFRDRLLAIIVRDRHSVSGVHFFTDGDLSQQLAQMSHRAGKTIEPHVHNRVSREVHFTQEVLFIKRGKLQVDFYPEDDVYRESRVLNAGDVILLIDGGHGFRVLEDVDMIEVKQGPYLGDDDKRCFPAVAFEKTRIGSPTA